MFGLANTERSVGDVTCSELRESQRRVALAEGDGGAAQLMASLVYVATHRKA